MHWAEVFCVGEQSELTRARPLPGRFRLLSLCALQHIIERTAIVTPFYRCGCEAVDTPLLHGWASIKTRFLAAKPLPVPTGWQDLIWKLSDYSPGGL